MFNLVLLNLMIVFVFHNIADYTNSWSLFFLYISTFNPSKVSTQKNTWQHLFGHTHLGIRFRHTHKSKNWKVNKKFVTSIRAWILSFTYLSLTPSLIHLSLSLSYIFSHFSLLFFNWFSFWRGEWEDPASHQFILL
jgi:hypothetical protein